MSATLVCPNCQHKFALDSAIEEPIALRLRQEFAAAAKTRDDEFAKREAALRAQQAQLAQAKESQKQQVDELLLKERAKLAAEARKLAETNLAAEMGDLKTQLDEKEKKLLETQQKELELRKQRRELEEKKAAFELESARAMDAERAIIKSETLKAADEAHRLKEAEKDKQLADMRRQIEELKRKAEQGSQQLQGDVLELHLEQILRATFPHDQISAVPTGIHGGDVVQKVLTPTNQHCGTILWESKRTKAWSAGWIEKLKVDQRAAKADLAIIVSTTLPKDIQHLAHIEGVWVTSCECMMGTATALREGLIGIANFKRAADGQHEKMEILYHYLSGHEFRQRVEAIVEAFTALRDDLEQEKKAMNRIWAKREKQIERVMISTTGMHGDLAGIIGAALPAIAAMDLPALAAADLED